MWLLGGALGQLDELLRPFYEADRRQGLDDEEAIWCLASLFFNDTHYSQIGGEAPDGHDLTSPLSFLILEAAHRLKIPVNLAVRVHEGMDQQLLERSVQYLLEDGSGASYSCAKGCVEGYMRSGFPRGLARMRAKVGCNWNSLPGIEYCLQDITRLCLVSPFLHALKDVVDDRDTAPTMDRLWARFEHHLEISVGVVKQGYDWHFAHHSRHLAEIVLNLFCHGPIERGLDISAGGVDIYRLNCDGLGLATVADSFAAIEQRVVREKRLSWQELAGHLERDYEGAEEVRLMLRGIPRFGCGDSTADGWAKRISERYSRMVAGSPTPGGYHLIPGLFSHTNVDWYGSTLPATPNGRHAKAAISHGANPDFAFMPDGSTVLTAKASAVAAVQPGYGNSAPLQIDLDREAFRDEDAAEKIAAFIRTHEAQGGTLVNINVISGQQILEAYEDPSRYPDLIVRVSGFSAYFSMLSPYFRKWVVDRILMRDGVGAEG
jgi:formate C-acetyltransferase